MNDDTKSKVVSWLTTPGNNFCILPYIHMAIESNGDIKPCCIGQPIKNPDGTVLNIKGKSISEAFNHPSRHKMIESFNANEQYKECAACWKDKSSFSARVKYSSKNPTIAFTNEVMLGNAPKSKLVYLEIKAGDRCNLKCRICGHSNSSQWMTEANNYQNHISNTSVKLRDSTFYAWHKQAEWIDDVAFWDNIDNLPDLEYVHIMGGEPWLIPEHFIMLEKIVMTGRAGHIILQYNTNATIKLNETQLNILRNFKKCIISLSVDDIGQRFEYQRKNAKWHETEQILKWASDLRINHKFSILVDATVGIFNILYLDEMITEMNKLNLPLSVKHYVNSGPYSIRSLSPDVKSAIRAKYENNQHSEHHFISNALAYMQTDRWSKELDQERLSKTKYFDSTRKESFSATFKEMAILLNYE